MFSSEGQFLDNRSSRKPATSNLKISMSPAIFLRRTGGRVWDTEFQNVLEQLEQNYPIPQGLQKLVTLDESFAHESEAVYQKEWRSAEENVLFPLPSNKEQKEIVQKLARNPGVVVQGPPGTGKSHTIANLICHLLAHGKRVLVTSEKERALEVLKDKIPEEVRDLCVSILGGDSKSVKEMETSIRTIAENLECKTGSILSDNINQFQREIDHARRQIARLQNELNRAVQLDNEEKWIAGVQFKPFEAAKWVKENQIHSWLPDSIIPGSRFPLAKEELKEFHRLYMEISEDDYLSLSFKRPNVDKLPAHYVFKHKVSEYQDIEQKFKEGKHYLEDWFIPEQLTLPLESTILQTKKYAKLLEGISEESWKSTMLREIDSSSEWGRFYVECKEQLRNLNDLEEPLLEYAISIPNQPQRKMLEDIEVMIQRMKQNKSIGWMFQTVVGKKYAYLLKQCSIDQMPVEYYNLAF